MKSLFKVLLWYPAAVITLFLLVSFHSQIGRTKGGTALLRQEMASFRSDPITFAALPNVAFEIKTALAQGDARPIIINRYLKHYGSPMEGMGDYIVKTSDTFGLDPYLVIAIAQQESNLGKLMPKDCHNAWGWGIHSAGTLCFSSWNEGINTFIHGISTKYIAYGLRTPEEIMTKYNATSPGGAWAKGVNQFLEELQTGSW